jgi:hypothetical protein
MISDNNHKANLFIIGAAKSATSLIYSILNSHEQINMSLVKEPNFFNSDYQLTSLSSYKKSVFKDIEKKIFNKKLIEPLHEAFIRDQNIYNCLFDFQSKCKYFGEASVNYFVSKNAAENIFNYNPDSKLILILRNPYERIISHFKMNIQIGQFKHSDFSSELKANINSNQNKKNPFESYLSHSLYFDNLNYFLKYFSKKQILILIQNDDLFVSNKIFHDLSQFLEISNFQETNIPKVNESKGTRNKLSLYLNKNNYIKLLLKKIFSKKLKKVLKEKFIYSKTQKNIEHNFEIPSEVKNTINEDIKKLETLINTDLSNWYA